MRTGIAGIRPAYLRHSRRINQQSRLTPPGSLQRLRVLRLRIEFKGDVMTTRMLIGEVVSDDLLKQIMAHMKEHIATIPGLVGHSILAEEGGRMVILITDWPNRQDCVTYHSSKAYRQFIAGTHHMLVGDCVIKLFNNRSE